MSRNNPKPWRTAPRRNPDPVVTDRAREWDHLSDEPGPGPNADDNGTSEEE